MKRLKILEIDQIECSRIVFDLPSLVKLKLKNTGSAQLSFVHPQSVRCAYVSSNSPLIGELINLESLFMDDFTDQQFPFEPGKNLKEFHFKSQQLSDPLLAKLKAQGKQRKELKIYFAGVHINCLASGVPELATTELICLHHTSLADVLVFLEEVDYSHLENFFNHNVPKSLVTKFRKVKRVNVEQKINDEQQLSSFLLGIAYLTEFSFIGSRLSQRFYDSLAQRSPFVQQLTIVDDLEIVNDLNLNIAFSFPYLQKFATNKFLDCELIESLFKKLRHLRLLKFKQGRTKFDVWFEEREQLQVSNVSRRTVCSFNAYRMISMASAF